ncbi:hypothetical protein ENBRE01_3391 [Enteropsectra breve]|nr:hypothetical protein ENBRE01_3391 [Enteropsectra breve]
MVCLQRIAVGTAKATGLHMMAASFFQACRATPSEDGSLASPERSIQISLTAPDSFERTSFLTDLRASAVFLGQNTQFKNYISQIAADKSMPIHFIIKEFIEESTGNEAVLEEIIDEFIADNMEPAYQNYELPGILLRKLFIESEEATDSFSIQLKIQIISCSTNDMLCSRYFYLNSVDVEGLKYKCVNSNEGMGPILRGELLLDSKVHGRMRRMVDKYRNEHIYILSSTSYGDAVLIRAPTLCYGLNGRDPFPLEYTDTSTHKTYKVKALLIKHIDSHRLEVFSIPNEHKISNDDIEMKLKSGAIYMMYAAI